MAIAAVAATDFVPAHCLMDEQVTCCVSCYYYHDETEAGEELAEP